MICPKCGKENDNDALYCGSCGTSLIEIKTSSDVAKEVTIDNKEKDEIELVLKPNTDVEMSKIESELDEEEDLRDVLSGTTTASVQMGANAQAQTVVHQAINEVDEKAPSLELPPTKTEELIALKQKEKAERDAKLAERRKELEKELNSKKKENRLEENKNTISDEKLKAIVSYFLPLTWLISFFWAGNKRSNYLTDKLNESLVLNIIHLLSFLPIIGKLLFWVAIILKVLGLVNTITDKNEKLPIIGDINILK